MTVDELLSGQYDKETASERAKEFLITELTGKVISANDVFDRADEQDISGRTLKRAKSTAGVRSFKKNNQWFWTIDGGSSEPEKQECQQLYIENLAPLPPFDGGCDADG